MGRDAAGRSRSDDRRFDDEQIFAILRAGEAEGASTAEFCASHGVAVPMYCLWKARYRHLSLPEFRTLRRQERQRVLILRASAIAGLTLVAGGAGLLVVPRGTAESAPVSTPPAVQSVAHQPSGRAPAASADPQATITPPPTTADASPGGGTAAPSVADGGFHVQISAEPDVQLARETVQRLVSAGYPAYVLPTTVGELELYRVRIGPFESRPDAQEILRRLERDGYEGPWIAK